jgi:hypothetical protein
MPGYRVSRWATVTQSRLANWGPTNLVGRGGVNIAASTSKLTALRDARPKVRRNVGFKALFRDRVRKHVFNSRTARFHFIHIPKNAGESVRSALYLERDVSFSSPFHYRYVDVADRVGRHLKFFAVIRNPWSRTASRYHFGRQNAPKWPTDDPRRVYIESASFEEFVRERKILPIPRHPDQPWMGPLSSWLNQLEWIRDESGTVVCDCLRMENLNRDLPAYLDRRVKLERSNVTKRSYDYRTMYTDELVEEVARLFRDDIEHFGFSFDGPATKNVLPAD